MHHARLFNSSRPRQSDSNNNSNSSPNTFTPNKRASSIMSSNQANLVVGSPSIRSRSSSLQMGRHFNTKSNENTIVVGRHHEKTSSLSREGGPRRTISQNDSIELYGQIARDPTIPIQLTIWFHEMRVSNEDFMIDLNLLPSFKIGDVLEVEVVDNKTTDTLKKAPKTIVLIIKKENVSNNSNPSVSTPVLHPQNTTSDDKVLVELPTIGEHPGPRKEPSQKISSHDLQATSSPFLSGQKGKNALQLSLISNPLQRIMDLLPRTMVQVKKIVDLETVEADTIELSIKNLNLSRDSMWIITSELINSCVYVSKRVSFMNNRVGIIKNIYKNGSKVFSGYIGKNTKIVYRSESAKLVFLIQTSREMWHFEESGEIMFHKLVNNLFPKIFRKWREREAHHSITIVLFTSVDLTDIPWTSLGHGERPNKVREYFRVVVDQVNIFHWNSIMENLRLEFANFKRDILLNKINTEKSLVYSVEGFVLPSVKGNMLEAINVGLSLNKDKFTDTDLKHSLTNFILITPGTGLFDVDYNLMLETSKKMASMDCALDIVCLSQPPLHIVPLFRYKDLSKNGKLSHCVPNWCDVSFYKDSSGAVDQWIPRCKIYELQMMGLMENEVNDIEIERFKPYKSEKSFFESMESYDADVFKAAESAKDPIEMNYSFSLFIEESDNINQMVKRSSPLGAHASLLLMKDTKIPFLKPKASAASINVGTNNSSVLGTVTNLPTEGSALTTLYHLKESNEAGSPLFKPKLISSSNNSIRSFTISSSSPSRESLHPKIIRKEDIFKPKEPNMALTPRRQSRRDDRENAEKSITMRGTKLSTTSMETSNHESDPLSYFWTEVENPSKEMHTDALLFLKQGKWSQVFPPKIKRNSVKWRSFESPAALPVFQSIFPTTKDLKTKYTTQLYSLILNYENNLLLETIDDLMREMIQLRLLLGFQVCDSEEVNKVEAERHSGNRVDSIVKYYQQSYAGSKIYMMLDNEIHRISNDGDSIGVQLYKKIEEATHLPIFKNAEFSFKDHRPLIRTRYADEYTPSNISFIEQKPKKYNWNQFDQLLAGYDDSLPEEKLSFFKMKFVVMPADIPKNAYFISNEHLTDEEIRVEGLRKLIAMIERGKYSADESSKKETINPEISFYTGNLYEFLSEQAENFDNTGKTRGSLLTTEKFKKSIKLLNLAHEIQSPGGLKIVDRTWHFTKHENCFIGSEFVTWLLENFEDINSREEATTYGQSLMNKGLFKHVDDRHGLLDGYYFYELEPDYIDRTYRPGKVSWFGRKKAEKDSASTSKNNSDTESFKSPNLPPTDSPDLRRIASIGAQLNSNQDSEVSSMADSAGSKSKTRKKFVLSKAVKYNADPLKKSYKPELIIVHYDRVHNPEHCFHIRLQWINTSTNFIDETINNWSRLCERHGLKFVETPWKELCTIPNHNAFHSFVDLKLAVNPLNDPEFANSEILSINKFYFHLFLLKKSGFLLDNRSAVYFLKDNIEISYSWGDPSFKYAQFIHKTGSYIVEVRDNGDFFLAPNNMHIARMNAPVSNQLDYNFNLNSYTIDSQRVMLGLKKTCTTELSLRAIFREAKDLWRYDFLKDILPTDI